MYLHGCARGAKRLSEHWRRARTAKNDTNFAHSSGRAEFTPATDDSVGTQLLVVALLARSKSGFPGLFCGRWSSVGTTNRLFRLWRPVELASRLPTRRFSRFPVVTFASALGPISSLASECSDKS